MKNTVNAAREFVSVILPPGTPGALRHLVSDLVRAYSGATERTDALLRRIDVIAQRFARGDYLQPYDLTSHQGGKNYYTVSEQTVPGQFVPD